MDIANWAAAIGVLALVIFVHELGHFLVAKWCDVEVLTFSVGFGPTLLAKTWGETEYRLALIPLGGYVRMAGQDDSEDLAASDPTRGFSAKKLWQRTAVVAAGPGVNFLFAVVVFAGSAMAFGQVIPSDAARVRGTVAELPADRAGIKAGDTVTHLDGAPIENWTALYNSITASKGKSLELTLLAKDGATRTVTLTPEKREDRDYLGEVVGERYVVGIERDMEHRAVGFLGSVRLGFESTWRMSAAILETLSRLFQGRLSARDLGGPVMIAQEASRRADQGMEPLLLFIALISVNLGIINILPIPVLDGGHLAFFLFEGIRGRPLSLRVREMAQQVGVFLIVALMVFVVFNDISRIIVG